MTKQDPFHFDRRDVLSSTDDHVLESIANAHEPVGVHHGGIAAVKVSTAKRLRRRFRIVVIPLHHRVAAHDDLADGFAVVRHLAIVFIHHSELARGNQLHALPGFDDCAFRRRDRIVFGPRLAHRDKRRRFGEPVDVRDRPSELAFDPLDRRRSRRRSRRDDAHACAGAGTYFGRRAGDADEHGWRGTHQRDPFGHDQLEHFYRIHLPQADVYAADGSNRPDEPPPVGVKHRQRPQIAIGRGHGQVYERANYVDVAVAVGNHHPLGP